MSDLEPGKLAAAAVGGKMVSILPQNFDDVVRFAKLAVMSGLFKAQTKRRRQNDDEDEQQTQDEDGKLIAQAQASMVILHGLELGISPMRAFDGITIINGRKCIYGSLIPALLRFHGCKIREWQTGAQFSDDYTAHCEITRPDGEVIYYSYSVADAKQAKLWQLDQPKVPGWEWYFDPQSKSRKKKWGTVENDANWFKHPKRMLIHRARGFCANDGCSDYLSGLYPAELMDDERQNAEPRDITPTQVSHSGFSVPAAPAEEKTELKSDPKAEEPPLTTPAQEKGETVLDELRIALLGAKTEDAAYDAWDELAKRIALQGRDVHQAGQAILEGHIASLPKQIEAKQELPVQLFVKSQTFEFDMMSVPAAE
jgi:hypothetical protein